MISALQNCEFCNSPAHVWFNCPKKPDGWKPDRLKRPIVGPPKNGPATKSTAALTEGPGKTTVRSNATAQSASDGITGDSARKRVPGRKSPAGTQAPPVDALKAAEIAAAHLAPKKRGRPKGKTDRKAYQRDLMRKRRAKP